MKKIGLLLAVLLVLSVCGIFLLYPTVNVNIEVDEFIESSRELSNPRRGFYQIYNFLIEDESKEYVPYIQELYEKDKDTTLSLVEINLRNYREGTITEAGLDNIEALFRALADIDKQLIVRFLYDWNGENEKYEPESMETILTHMKQMAPVLESASNIFIVQGLFIGHWGEMHGTEYSSVDDMRQLLAQLDAVVDPSTFLAVRTPAQWRDITGLDEGTRENLENNRLARRLGLFNDGMLGSESDFGTYEIYETEGGESAGRFDELAFQEELCRTVPNGGEVICDNSFNDFEDAVKDLETMHVTYLNNAYDENVLKKWENTLVTEEGCFQGMDGLSYIERRLGYRLLIADATYEYDRLSEHVTIRIQMKNVGFAPLYREPEASLVLYHSKTGNLQVYGTESNLCGLAGGAESDRPTELNFDIDLSGLSNDTYAIYFLLTDPDTDTHILLANEQDAQQYGYYVGIIEPQNGLQYIRMLLQVRNDNF